MKKRIVSVFLLSAIVASLAACTDNTSETEDTTDETTAAPITNPAGIEACDYGLTFNIHAIDWEMYQRYFFADDTGTDVMTKAIYDRELAVEEHLGVEIEYTLNGTSSDQLALMQQMVMTGDDTYQLMLTHVASTAGAMVTDNLLYNFKDFQYIDLTKDWWNQSANETFTAYGKQYYAISDYMIPNVNCLFFNKELLAKYQLEDPYELVKNGEWTIDKMTEMMAAVTKDDGNGSWGPEDTYGFATPDGHWCNGFIFSCGLRISDKNADDELVFAFSNDRTFTVFEKLDKLLKGPDTYVYPYICEPEERIDPEDGRALFNITMVANLYAYRDVNIDFGILPLPKTDEHQESYAHFDRGGLMAVPKTVDNEEMVGKVIELLSYYSQETTYPAFFETMLGEKFTRDPESHEILKIIYDNVVYDAAYTYMANIDPGIYHFSYSPDELVIKGRGSAGLSSFIATNKSSAEAAIKDLNATFKALAEAE